ncbi:uncharacterized protein [Drosophila kikkawai]|uniref:Uncharacterized protein isoform X1 n=1 Tax=Drosophila kikkawai TaxID=30033 RepID=A0ABM4G984_DROKI
MCKFTNRLFVFALLLLALGGSLAQPASGRRNVVSDLLEVLYEDYNDNDFQREDVFYDQRQKGAENLQLSVDGVVIGMSPQMGPNLLYSMAAKYLSEMMLRKSTTEPDIDELFEDDPVTKKTELPLLNTSNLAARLQPVTRR